MRHVPVLALDTSGDITVCVVQPAPDGGHVVLSARRVTEQRRHAEMLAPMITAVLDEAGTRRDDLTAVVVGTGPAPFTGLRAGLVTARVLAFALGIEVHGVCSLDGLAAQAFAAGVRGEVLVVSDACSAATPEAHAASLESLGLLAEITTTDELIAAFAPQPADATT